MLWHFLPGIMTFCLNSFQDAVLHNWFPLHIVPGNSLPSTGGAGVSEGVSSA